MRNMKFAGRRLALLLTLSLLTGCGERFSAAASPSSTFFAMDTVMELTVSGEEELLSQAKRRVYELEDLLSVTRETSEIYRLNQTGSGVLSQETGELLSAALSLCDRTGGALDISIYPVLRAWGFTTGEYSVPSEDTLTLLLERVDYEKIQYDEKSRRAELPGGMEIDFGSVAKGYTGDVLTAFLREKGVTSALLSLGGNVQALGNKPGGQPWQVGVQNPVGEGYVGILSLADQAAVTSGGYQRYFEENGNTYWHILDPATGKPVKSGLSSVTIVGNSGLVCDGLSTALFVMGLEKAARFWKSSEDFEAVFVGQDGSVAITEGLEDKFTLSGDYKNAELTVLRRS